MGARTVPRARCAAELGRGARRAVKVRRTSPLLTTGRRSYAASITVALSIEKCPQGGEHRKHRFQLALSDSGFQRRQMVLDRLDGLIPGLATRGCDRDALRAAIGGVGGRADKTLPFQPLQC